jgi:hypothetical protein
MTIFTSMDGVKLKKCFGQDLNVPSMNNSVTILLLSRYSDRLLQVSLRTELMEKNSVFGFE